MYHPFSVAETLKIAWHLFKKNFATIAVYSLVAFIIFIGLPFIIYNFLDGNILETIGFIILLISISFVFLGFIKLVFILIDKAYYDFDFSDIVPTIKMIYSYILLLIVVSTISVIMSNAVALLHESIIRYLLGLLILLFFQFFFLFYFPICTCFIVDDGSGPFESVAQSFQLIKGNFIKYILLFILIEALVFLGAITVIGMIMVIPFVNIVLVVAYRKLVYSHKDVDDDIAETL
ncbi:hypothetical protein BH09BAC6_BH09BAC6_07790 [soil metagenome]|jgi:uncharacterized membrane protein